MSSSPESVRNTSVGDQAANVDSLGFKPYVTAIAEFLLNPETKPPLTLSIEGEWGSGKSFFMKKLDEYLRKEGKRTVWFNAWRHDKAEAVWAAFALSFITAIFDQTHHEKAISKAQSRDHNVGTNQEHFHQ